MADIAASVVVPDARTVTIQSPVATPTQSPPKRPILITLGQKQALIDNLQLEITERARKLRAQYALQAQSLRTRIELRVNRIPKSMRKQNMGELFEKYLESTEQTSKAESSQSNLITEAPKQPGSPAKLTAPSPSKPSEPALPRARGIKRPSDHFSADDAKENTPEPTQTLSPKKRPKHNNVHPSNPSAILSPRSPNARPHPHQSPIRPLLGSPQKSYLSHPTSPLKPSGGFPSAPKPASPAKAAAVIATATAASSTTNEKTSRSTRARAAAAPKPAKAPTTAAPKAKAAPITRAKRGAEPTAEVARNQSRTASAASNTSTGTAVVRKVGRGAVAAKGKPKEAGGKATAKNVTAAAVEAPAQGRRVLRKRG
ncbi:MAG: hypothetical protein LQ338_004744 [Usnochroma carphineum]|nr:MAG: hypothetical protein LQ338_004744 [Usnochroma carphineum]